MKNNSEHRRYEAGDWREDAVNAWWARLYVGGNLQAAEMVCRAACFPKGLCVTIEPTTYIFAGGSEPGVCIGFIQYPPFPEEVATLRQKAIDVGRAVAEACYQWSFSIVTPGEIVYLSRRRS